MNAYLTAGLAALAGAALLEAALAPGLVIGGAAVLAPAVLLKRKRRPRRAAARGGGDRQGRFRAESPIPPRRGALSERAQPSEGPKGFALMDWTRLARDPGVKQAILKTITFRIVVTGLDFSANLLVIGEFAPAAGLSAFSLMAGPAFYFLHETLWNSYGPVEGAVEVRLPRIGASGEATSEPLRAFVLNRAVAKTITFRTVATVMDFAANFVVTGNAATAALLTSFGFVLGPFVYLGHEMAWERLARRSRAPVALPAPTGG